MPVVPEAIGPWLAPAVAAAAANVALVLSGRGAPAQHALLLLLLAATMAGAGLVAARSNEEVRARDREERGRPAADELARAGPPVLAGAYLEGMHRWAVAVDELLAHAIAAAGADDPCRGPLTSAAEDTADLLDLLRTADADLGLNDRATLHAICNLWETSLEHVEPAAAAVDPGWHRRWQARAVVARRLRHGQIDAPARPLPYRT